MFSFRLTLGRRLTYTIVDGWRSLRSVSAGRRVVYSNGCLGSVRGDFILSGFCCFKKKLISLSVPHTVLFTNCLAFEKVIEYVFLSTPAIQMLDCFVYHHQNTEERIAIHLCSKV